MNWTNLSHEDASKYARRAQWAFGVIGLGAVAVAAVGTKPAPTRTLPPLDIPAAPVSVKANESQNGANRVAFDPKAIADRFDLLGNHPRPAIKPEDAPGEQPNVETVTPAENVRFLGALKEPTRSVALLKIGSKQRFLAAGESAEGVTVIEVSHDKVVIQEGGVEKRLDLQARLDGVVTIVSGGRDAGTQAGRGVIPAMNNARQTGQPVANNPAHDPKRILELRERAERDAAEAQKALFDAESKARESRGKSPALESRRVTPRKQPQENGDQR